MDQKIIGFIGGGNMASAIMGGLLSSGLSDKDHIIAADKSPAAVERLQTTFGIPGMHRKYTGQLSGGYFISVC